jgi:SAM-dependent methyltransferase
MRNFIGRICSTLRHCNGQGHPEIAMDSLKQKLRRAVVRWLPEATANSVLALKHRRNWRRDGGSHLEYHAQYATRSVLIDELRNWLGQGGAQPPRVLEFGCSGANNLRLMRERGVSDVEYCGLDINPNAIAFARRIYPAARFHVCDDLAFGALAPSLGHFDAFLAFAVLYYIPPDRVLTLLKAARQSADTVLICDDLSLFDADAGGNDGLFLHPWAALCREAGLEVVAGPVASTDPSNRHGYFVARPSAVGPQQTR